MKSFTSLLLTVFTVTVVGWLCLAVVPSDANYDHHYHKPCPHHVIHKTKTVKVPYPVVKKIPEVKVIKVPYKVPVKVPVYIPIKEEKKYEHKYEKHDGYGHHYDHKYDHKDDHYKKA